MDHETRDEILQGEPRFYAVELIEKGWCVRDAITGKIVDEQCDGEAEAVAVAKEKSEKDGSWPGGGEDKTEYSVYIIAAIKARDEDDAADLVAHALRSLPKEFLDQLEDDPYILKIEEA